MNTSSIILFIIAAFEISLLSVLLMGSKERSPRAFAFFLSVNILWVISHGIFQGLDPVDGGITLSIATFFGITTIPALATFLVSINYFLGIMMGAGFVYFTKVFETETKPSAKFTVFITTITLIQLPLYLTGHIVTDARYIGGLQGWMWSYGDLSFLFDIFFTLFFVIGQYTLYRKYRAAQEGERKNLTFMFWAMIIGFLFASPANIILPRFGIFSFDWLGPITGLGWLTVLSYSIIRFKQMNVRTVGTQLIILSLILILFFNIFISSITEKIATTLGIVVKTIIFFIFIAVGRVLISNIFKESERKKQVEVLNNKMETLHSDLEQTVVERTRELAEAKIHSETILENLTLGIIEYDENFTILRVNRATENLLGIERKAIVGNILQPKDISNEKLSSLSTVLYPTLSEDGHKVDTREEFEEDLSKNEVVINYPKRRELQVITLPLKGLYANEKPRFVKLLRDVTHENLVDRSKSEFIKIAAHQLRTPLSGAKWAIRATLDGDLGPISPEQKELLQKIYDANKNLIDVVNDLLDVTHIEESSGYHKDLNNIADAIREAISGSLLLAKDKKLTIFFDEKNIPDIPLFVFDKIKVLIAIKNVLTNAIDYTPEGGEITISLTQHASTIEIMLVDNGVGISKEDTDHLFTRFYRSKDASMNLPYRSGLGLYVAKDILQQHNGTITIESEKGMGTRAVIRLPIVDPKPLPQATTA